MFSNDEWQQYIKKRLLDLFPNDSTAVQETKIIIVEDSTLFAFANVLYNEKSGFQKSDYPGITFSTGFLRFLRDTTEVGLAIAHEFGHHLLFKNKPWETEMSSQVRADSIAINVFKDSQRSACILENFLVRLHNTMFWKSSGEDIYREIDLEARRYFLEIECLNLPRK